MTEQTHGGTSLRFVLGIVWSVLLIIVPGYLWTQGFHTELMFGAAVGAVVRFGTDMTLMGLTQDASAQDFSRFAEKHMPIVVLMMIVQFGTLIAGAGFWLLGGDTMGAGIVLGMVLSYLFGLLTALVARDSTETEVADDEGEVDDADEESEWRFDVDDV